MKRHSYIDKFNQLDYPLKSFLHYRNRCSIPRSASFGICSWGNRNFWTDYNIIYFHKGKKCKKFRLPLIFKKYRVVYRQSVDGHSVFLQPVLFIHLCICSFNGSRINSLYIWKKVDTKIKQELALIIKLIQSSRLYIFCRSIYDNPLLFNFQGILRMSLFLTFN